MYFLSNSLSDQLLSFTMYKSVPGGGGGTAMGYIGMCRCEGYGFQAVYSGMGGYPFPGN